jgi:uncharacterized protein
LSATLPSQEIIDQFVGNAHGNLPVVKELLEQYPSLITANASWTETAIEAAAQTGQVDIVTYLLAHGAKYDICTAAMLGDLDKIKKYIEKDHNLINARGAHGIPLLYYPVIHSHVETANFLYEHGADPNAAFPGGITPLHCAVMNSQSQFVKWLLEHGADPNPRYEGKTPSSMAMEGENSELTNTLRSYGGIE